MDSVVRGGSDCERCARLAFVWFDGGNLRDEHAQWRYGSHVRGPCLRADAPGLFAELSGGD